ncbi:uncharacterized protein LOC131207383 [Anopheles bellator]|uniref:uncharacterized protein LOC131207383 n=1 Tax=Anopheles bellator TaxID=139047 RepID=UPI00264A26B2|nr:uncharacterized protein LOC131207383 [Anopheles bellator]
MQQQLNEISVIPMQIHATLSFLTKTLSKFAPPELQMELPEALRSSTTLSNDEVRETNDPINLQRLDEEDESTQNDPDEEFAITLESLFDESEVLESLPARNGVEDDNRSDQEEDTEPEMSEEERLRIEKLERVIKLQKSWPWSQTEKPIHKRSNCHLVPSIALERSKIKQFPDREALPFYKHAVLQRAGH